MPNALQEHDEQLRKLIVSILASSSNGCIQELGYPKLLREHELTVKEVTKLRKEKGELIALRDDWKAAAQRMGQELSEKNVLVSQQRRIIGQKESTIRALQIENEKLTALVTKYQVRLVAHFLRDDKLISNRFAVMEIPSQPRRQLPSL